jgi:hypothetical protein
LGVVGALLVYLENKFGDTKKVKTIETLENVAGLVDNSRAMSALVATVLTS